MSRYFEHSYRNESGNSIYLKDIRNSGSNICNCVYLSYVCMLCIWKQLLQTVSCYCSALTTLAVGQVTASRSVQVNRRPTQVMLKFSPAPGNSVAHHSSVVLRMHNERALQLWLVIPLQMWSTCEGNRHFFLWRHCGCVSLYRAFCNCLIWFTSDDNWVIYLTDHPIVCSGVCTGKEQRNNKFSISGPFSGESNWVPHTNGQQGGKRHGKYDVVMRCCIISRHTKPSTNVWFILFSWMPFVLYCFGKHFVFGLWFSFKDTSGLHILFYVYKYIFHWKVEQKQMLCACTM